MTTEKDGTSKSTSKMKKKKTKMKQYSQRRKDKKTDSNLVLILHESHLVGLKSMPLFCQVKTKNRKKEKEKERDKREEERTILFHIKQKG